MGDKLYLKIRLEDEEGACGQEFESRSPLRPMFYFEPYLINRCLYESVREKHKEITEEVLDKAIETIILHMQENGFYALKVNIDKFMNREREIS